MQGCASRGSRALIPLLLVALAGAAGAQPDRAVLPLGLWDRLQSAVDAAPPSAGPLAAWAGAERVLEGRLRDGLLEADLDARFDVLSAEAGAVVEVPVLDAQVAVVDVTLDGAPAALRTVDGFFAVPVARPGPHRVRARFLARRTSERFERGLTVRLPAGGPTRFALRLPEIDIDPVLAQGVLTAQSVVDGGTLLEGAADADGVIDLTWTRRAAGPAVGAARIEARQVTLLTVQPALITGVTRLHLDGLEGETDRFALRVPAGVEVVEVSGDDLLQWQTDAPVGGDGGRRLTALTTHLIADQAELTVRFQLAVQPGGTAVLALPGPELGVLVRGAAGVLAPAGLDVTLVARADAEVLDVGALPTDLVDATATPITAGFAHGPAPRVALSMVRNSAVPLTDILIDQVQASTVLLEDGLEVTKIALHVRNNTRQHLGIELPAEARPLQAFVDGRPVQPALDEAGGRLLLPLRQSERLDRGERFHTVQPGENLGRIAYLYYGNPQRWPTLVDANDDQIGGEAEVYVGQRLRVPPLEGAQVEESRFVVELAYARQGERLGMAGRRALTLPRLDVDAVEAAWHLYLPAAIEPLDFEANLTQHTAIRYDPFRRLRHSWERAVGPSEAEAGEGYQSILSQRKALFMKEGSARAGDDAIAGSFPLVGERYRFRRLLLGVDVPRVEVTYVEASAVTAVRFGAMVLAFCATLLAFGGARRVAWLVAALPILAALLVLGHFVLGVNRHVVWGADLGLAWLLLQPRRAAIAAALRGAVAAPGAALGWLSLRNLVALVGVLAVLSVAVSLPLLRPLTALAALVALWWLAKARAAVPALVVAGLMAVAPSAGAQDEAESAARFESILAPQNEDAQVAPAADLEALADEGGEARVELPLERVVALRAAARARAKAAQRRAGPAVVLGAARYHGHEGPGGLDLTLDLDVTLGRSGAWKTVPLVGTDVALAAARIGDEPLPVTQREGYHVWLTQRTGVVRLTLRLLVPARGPRGSIEYAFTVARTPATRLTCLFPQAGLEPQIDGAVRSEVTPREGGSALAATLSPTTRVHLVGFRDLGEGEALEPALYAENLDLLSVGDRALELFRVTRYSILYAGARRFEVRIPAGFTVVSAKGEGGFRYAIEPDAEGSVLRGETAQAVRSTYELSLHLRRELPGDGAPGTTQAAVTLPRGEGLTRESGWIAVEVPGALRVQVPRHDGALPVDLRQLPPELLRSTVSPVLHAFRYDTPDAGLDLALTRLAPRKLEAGSVDSATAYTVVTEPGRTLTELRLTLRNRARHRLAMRLPEGARVRTALLDGNPVKVSADAEGRLLLPLERSAGPRGESAFEVSVVVEREGEPLGLLGWRDLALPTVDLPIRALKWSVFLPARNSYGEPQGDVAPQVRAGRARWSTRPRPETEDQEGMAALGALAAPTEGGSVPVRVNVPRTGHRLDTTRYWIEADQAVSLRVPFARTWLRYPAGLACALATMAALLLLGRARRLRLPLAAVAAASAFATQALAGAEGVAAAVLAALVVLAWRGGWVRRTLRGVGRAGGALRARWTERAEAPRWTLARLAATALRLSVAGAMIYTLVLIGRAGAAL